jgi:hypothetical protein
MDAGRELDALIAEKVMGWNMSPAPFGTTQDVYQCWHQENRPLMTIHMWTPSTDITAAWEVIEKMKDKGWGYIFVNGPTETSTNFWFYKTDDENHTASSMNEPHAICLAALKAVSL